MGHYNNINKINIKPLETFHTSKSRSEFPNNKPFGTPVLDSYVNKIVQKQEKTFSYRKLENKILQLEQKFEQYHLQNTTLLNLLANKHVQDDNNKEQFYGNMSAIFMDLKQSMESFIVSQQDPNQKLAEEANQELLKELDIRKQEFSQTFNQLNNKINCLKTVNKALEGKLTQTFTQGAQDSQKLSETTGKIARLYATNVNNETNLAITVQKHKKRTIALEHQLQEVSNKCITNLKEIKNLKDSNVSLVARNNLTADYQKKYQHKNKEVGILSAYIKNLKEDYAKNTNEHEVHKMVCNLKAKNYALETKTQKYRVLSKDFVSAFNTVKQKTAQKDNTIISLKNKLEAVSAENILLKRKGTFLDANLRKQMVSEKVAVGKVANVSLSYTPERIAEKVETFNKSLKDLKDIREKILVKRNSYKKADQKAFVKKMDTVWGRLNWTMNLKN
ncbi:MAG: hypothetical protein HN833_05325 [Elusimicrobiaceae bacterium]|jgi:hypothetical protein|nr:hypothetical protein [Elusimicrobiaceae bacterium]MBT3955021.1 hypothetical protein [Elusimicrobiaceae bacterium]MBT4008087.1 hypothetical protein [Elusimicrobiaceae bacterium]MBT4402717.1 hypothetical protein [Elusimicrobiaceae bacterium]MBT4439999.1 hypothetical protein [Elusimicrobiaceae bacterium]